jgi:hypothetical protein
MKIAKSLIYRPDIRNCDTRNFFGMYPWFQSYLEEIKRLLDLAGESAMNIESYNAVSTGTTYNTLYLLDATTSFTFTAPTAVGETGKEIRIKMVAVGVGEEATIATSGGLIDTLATYVLNTDQEAITLISDGTDWHITGKIN